MNKQYPHNCFNSDVVDILVYSNSFHDPKQQSSSSSCSTEQFIFLQQGRCGGGTAELSFSTPCYVKQQSCLCSGVSRVGFFSVAGYQKAFPFSHKILSSKKM